MCMTDSKTDKVQTSIEIVDFQGNKLRVLQKKMPVEDPQLYQYRRNERTTLAIIHLLLGDEFEL